MSYKADIPEGSTDFYVALQNGDDIASGNSLEQAKLTIDSAITDIGNLSPFAFKTLITSQGGLITTEGYALPNRTTVDFSNIAISGDIDTCIELGSTASVKLATVGTTAENGVCYLIDGQTELKITGEAQTACEGINSRGLKIQGECDDVFASLSQMRAGDKDLDGTGSEGSICIDITGESDLPIDINIDTASLEGNDTTFMVHNPSTVSIANTRTAVNLTSLVIRNYDGGGGGTPTGCEGFRIKGGEFTLNAGYIDMDSQVAIIVESGAEMSAIIADLHGDVIVDAGGELNIFALHHPEGDVFPNGELNGIIGGNNYGSYVDGSNHFLTVGNNGSIRNNWNTIGTLTLDADLFSLDDVIARFEQFTSSARTVDFRVIDDTLTTVYFDGGVSGNTATGLIPVPLGVDTAWPVTGNIKLLVQVDRTGSGSGIATPYATIEFSDI